MDIEKLIETLRQHGVLCVRTYGRYCSICDEAATALSTLQDENEKLRKELEWKDMVIELAQRKEREAKAELEQVKAELNSAKSPEVLEAYETLKQVEDTCRSMIASYEADRLTYEQYKDSDDDEQQSWAEQAKMRANRTASTYNNYILENSYVWSGNVPNDIDSELDYLE